MTSETMRHDQVDWCPRYAHLRRGHFAFHSIPKLPDTLVRDETRAYFDFFFDPLTYRLFLSRRTTPSSRGAADLVLRRPGDVHQPPRLVQVKILKEDLGLVVRRSRLVDTPARPSGSNRLAPTEPQDGFPATSTGAGSGHTVDHGHQGCPHTRQGFAPLPQLECCQVRQR
jgi:hypothetical protein